MSYYSKKLCGYTPKELIMDLLPNISISLIMGLIVYSFTWMSNIPSYIVLAFQIILGIFIYLILSMLTKNRSYIYLRDKFLKSQAIEQ